MLNVPTTSPAQDGLTAKNAKSAEPLPIGKCQVSGFRCQVSGGGKASRQGNERQGNYSSALHSFAIFRCRRGIIHMTEIFFVFLAFFAVSSNSSNSEG